MTLNMAASKKSSWKKLREKFSLGNLLYYVLHPHYSGLAMLLSFIAEVFVNVLVINRIKYTEIDWVAYMQEVEGVVNGTLDYTQLKGDTGPLVYPAGFVYVYLVLYYVTGAGLNIRLAQYLFAGLYLISLIVIFDIYTLVKRVPPYVFVFMCCASYRIHSIYVLRLFNDPVAMLYLFVAIDLFLRDHWSTGCLAFSLGVSIKMNVLLFAPALLMLLMVRFGTLGTIKHLVICAAPQVVLGLPFLTANPVGYISRSFNLGRQFFFKWTVNWRLLSEEMFLNRYFHVALLLAHIVVLIAFFYFKWRWLFPEVNFKFLMEPISTRLTPPQILLPMFTANFIGMCFSRSLHYQFYVWYFHTLHLLLWCTSLPTVVRILLLGMIELSWNTYPSTVFSSSCLHVCHGLMLCGLWYSPLYSPRTFKIPVGATKME